MSPQGLRQIVAAALATLVVWVVIAVVYSTRLVAWIVGCWAGLGVALWVAAELWSWRVRVRQRRGMEALPPTGLLP